MSSPPPKMRENKTRVNLLTFANICMFTNVVWVFKVNCASAHPSCEGHSWVSSIVVTPSNVRNLLSCQALISTPRSDGLVHRLIALPLLLPSIKGGERPRQWLDYYAAGSTFTALLVALSVVETHLACLLWSAWFLRGHSSHRPILNSPAELLLFLKEEAAHHRSLLLFVGSGWYYCGLRYSRG